MSSGEKIGYRYAHRYGTEDDIILCCNCQFNYNTNDLSLHSELWSIDNWARRQLCKSCRRTLEEASQEEKAEEAMESMKRGPGRPRSGRKPRLDITLSQEVIDFINWRIGEDGNLSGYLDRLVKEQPDYEVWKHSVK